MKCVKIGAAFEQIFETRARKQGWHTLRIADGCKTFGRNQMIRVKQPFDFIACKDYKYLFVDCKTLQVNTFGYSLVKPHQAQALKGLESPNAISGYIVWFRKIDKVVFFAANRLIELKKETGLGVEDGIPLGNIQTFRLGILCDLQ